MQYNFVYYTTCLTFFSELKRTVPKIFVVWLDSNCSNCWFHSLKIEKFLEGTYRMALRTLTWHSSFVVNSEAYTSFIKYKQNNLMHWQPNKETINGVRCLLHNVYASPWYRKNIATPVTLKVSNNQDSGD